MVEVICSRCVCSKRRDKDDYNLLRSDIEKEMAYEDIEDSSG
jgi:hypothetical protein